jgi:hypothetical protein
MACWKVLLASVVVLLAASSARAGDRETQERTAKKACLLGDFKKGTEILADLYLDTNDPTYVFNQGRCLEQNGQNEPAILRFQEYLRKAEGLSPADADAVRKRIDDLQAALDHRAKPALAVPVPVPNPAPEATAPAATTVGSTIPTSAAPVPTPEPLGLAQSAPNPEPPASPPVYKRWWFWTGVGVVVVGGVVTAIVLSSKSAAKSPPCDQGVPCGAQ